MSRSPFQRFAHELRRRHVPQTAAIYLVAAWAAIEFSDVVVPNLNGPQWIVTAVIIAALVGFPVMLVVAWVFEWGPEGIHRTPDGATERTETPPSYDPETGEIETPPARRAEARRDRSQPWLAAVAVLVVGIGSALAVAYVLRGGSGPEAAAPPADTATRVEGAGRPDGAREGVEALPDAELLGPGLADSVASRIAQALGALDSIDVSGLVEVGRRAAAQAGVGIMISEPPEWRVGAGPAPVALARGDTLVVEGAAYDSAGVAMVSVDGAPVAEPATPQEVITFTAVLVGRSGVGSRTVTIVAQTTDGREIRREFEIIQLPGGTP